MSLPINAYLKHRNKLLFGNSNTIPVHAVHDVYDGVSVGIVTSPVRPNACLTSQVPNLKLQVLVRNCLNVESDS